MGHVPRFRRDRQIYRHAARIQLRRISPFAGRTRNARPEQGFRPGQRPVQRAALQGRNRSQPSHLSARRISDSRSPRLPGARHGHRRMARRVLGFQRTDRTERVPPFLQPDGSSAANAETGLHLRRNVQSRRRNLKLRPEKPACQTGMDARRRERPDDSRRLVAGDRRRDGKSLRTRRNLRPAANGR